MSEKSATPIWRNDTVSKKNYSPSVSSLFLVTKQKLLWPFLLKLVIALAILWPVKKVTQSTGTEVIKLNSQSKYILSFLLNPPEWIFAISAIVWTTSNQIWLVALCGRNLRMRKWIFRRICSPRKRRLFPWGELRDGSTHARFLRGEIQEVI